VEHGRAGDDNPDTSGDDARDIVDVDTAVDFDGRVVADPIEQRPNRTNFGLAPRDESLSPEPRIDGHDQDEVDVGGDLLERANGRRGVQNDAGLCAQGLDGVDRAMEVRQHFDMHRDHAGARLGECVEVLVGIHDHQVNIQRNLRDSPNRFHDRRSDGDVRDEMAVHDVDVDQIGAAALGRADRVAKRGKVGCQDRGGDEHAHRLTSREIGSPGPI